MSTLNRGPEHFNRNPPCAVSIDRLQVAVLPLDHGFRPHPRVMPFHLDFRETAHVPARDLFERWCVNTLLMSETRRIFPVCWAWHEQRPLMEDWLGSSYEELIGEQVRDVQAACLFHNDRAAVFGEEIQFVSPSLSNVLTRLNLPPADRHALSDCRGVASAWRELTRTRFPGA